MPAGVVPKVCNTNITRKLSITFRGHQSSHAYSSQGTLAHVLKWPAQWSVPPARLELSEYEDGVFSPAVSCQCFADYDVFQGGMTTLLADTSMTSAEWTMTAQTGFRRLAGILDGDLEGTLVVASSQLQDIFREGSVHTWLMSFLSG